MPSPRVRFRTIIHKDKGLKQAPKILQKHLKGGLLTVGKRLQASARTRMKKDEGTSRDSLTYRVTISGLNMNLLVYSTLVQAFVDAYGLRRGVFPDFRVNSKLHNWVKRRMRGVPTAKVSTVGTPAGPAFRAAGGRRMKVRKVRSIKKLKGNAQPTKASNRQRAKNSDSKRLTFLVARAIYRRGLQASRWNKKTLEANKARIVREMQNALARAANEIKRA